MSNYIDIKILNTKMLSSSGYEILQEMNTLNDSVRVLNTNHEEIQKHLQNFKNFSITITLNSLHPNLETKRLMHNYLASAISLIDHTRIHITNIHKEKKFLDYQPMVKKTFIENPHCVFIKDFRQYLQHYKLPDISFQANALSLKPKWSIKISTSELEKFSGWKKDSKIFIKSKYPRLDLLEVTDNYQKIVNDFYKWLIKNQKEIFSDELNQLEELKIEIKKAKISNTISSIILKNFKSFETFEREFNLILSKEEKENIEHLNQLDKIDEILLILNPNEVIKNVIREKLNTLLSENTA